MKLCPLMTFVFSKMPLVSGNVELVQGVNNGCKQVESSITSSVYVQFISNLACLNLGQNEIIFLQAKFEQLKNSLLSVQTSCFN